jgi:hypothetical protein
MESGLSSRTLRHPRPSGHPRTVDLRGLSAEVKDTALAPVDAVVTRVQPALRLLKDIAVPTYPPPAAELVAPLDRLAFHHGRSILPGRKMTDIDAWNLLSEQPLPLLKTAFSIRDAISARLSVNRIGGSSGLSKPHPKVGDKFDFAQVKTFAARMLTLTERDRHLDVTT